MHQLFQEFKTIDLEKINFWKIKTWEDILSWIKIKWINEDTKKVLNLALSSFWEDINKEDKIEDVFKNISNKFEKEWLNEENSEKELIATKIQLVIEKYKNRALEIELLQHKKKIWILKIKNSIDELTGLKNRKTLEQYLDLYIKQWEDFSVIFADIDYFKKINDNFWHNNWDEILKNLAKIFKNNIRWDDIVWRWWWEEFIIILNNINYKQVDTKIENLRIIIQNELFKSIKNNLSKCLKEKWCENSDLCNKENKDFYCFKNNITCSFWIFNIDNEYIEKISNDKNAKEKIIKNADLALYKAKEKRNTICTYLKKD